MSGLHANNNLWVFLDCLSAQLRIHFINALFQPAVHAIGDNVQESQYPYLGVVNDFFFLLKKSLRPGGPCIHNRGHAGLQGNISWDSKRFGVCSTIRCEPVQRRPSVADMKMNVDEPGGYI